jgi:CRP/FNR family transcriptional regulator, cyclic AMP receptor protein
MPVTVDRSGGTTGAAFFESLDAKSQQGLLDRGRCRRYPVHSILFFEGDDATSVFVIREGMIKLSMTVDGREVVLDVLGRGDVLGELSVIEGRDRSATATAMTPVDAVSIPAASFLGAVTESPHVACTLLRSLAGRLRSTSRRQVEYGALDAVGRVCRRLVEMLDRYGRECRSGIVIEAPLTQSDIAAWAGLSREAVVKALHAMRRLGWITTTPRSITVTNLDAVVARASLDRD